MRGRTLSIAKSSVARRIVPGLAWIVTGIINLQNVKQSMNKIADIMIAFLLLSMVVTIIYGLVKKTESPDELVEEHEKRSKIFSFTATLLICSLVAVFQDVPFLEFSISMKSILSFVLGTMNLLQGISFLVYEKIDSSNPPDDIFSMAAEAG